MRRSKLVPLFLGVLLVGCGSGFPFGSDDDTIQETNVSPDAPSPSTNPPPPVEGDVPPSGQPLPVAESFTADVDNPFFPLEPGSVRIYEGQEEGEHRRDELRVLAETTVIAGVECRALFQEVYLDGELAELTTEWFAQDPLGNVWKFGEESLEEEDGEFVLSDDSWRAGEGDGQPWLFMGADPQVGDRYAGFVPGGEDVNVVVSVTASADVPAGAFQNLLEVVENGQSEEEDEEEDDTDIILYGQGVGLVSETAADGYLELIGIGQE